MHVISQLIFVALGPAAIASATEPPHGVLIARDDPVPFRLTFIGNTDASTPSVGRKSAGRDRRSVTMPEKRRRRAMQTLPEIRSFAEQPSDRFLVDVNVVRTGHPYKGENAQRPHTGGHIYFRISDKPLPLDDMAAYPAIYAVADGFVSRIDYSFRLREMFEPALGRRVANYRYGIGLMFATMDDNPVELHYSIEPFVDPENDKFYERFILVQPGQRVKKGEVLARMYIPQNRELARKSHVHFNLIGGKNHRFMSPSIFTGQIVKRFQTTWDRFGNDGMVRDSGVVGRKTPFLAHRKLARFPTCL